MAVASSDRTHDLVQSIPANGRYLYQITKGKKLLCQEVELFRQQTVELDLKNFDEDPKRIKKFPIRSLVFFLVAVSLLFLPVIFLRELTQLSYFSFSLLIAWQSLWLFCGLFSAKKFLRLQPEVVIFFDKYRNQPILFLWVNKKQQEQAERFITCLKSEIRDSRTTDLLSLTIRHAPSNFLIEQLSQDLINELKYRGVDLNLLLNIMRQQIKSE